jgi:hypothetical protein
VNSATQAILRAARRNPAITSRGLIDEMERGDIGGWMHLASVRSGNFADWTRAMCEAAAELGRLENHTVSDAFIASQEECYDNGFMVV